VKGSEVKGEVTGEATVVVVAATVVEAAAVVVGALAEVGGAVGATLVAPVVPGGEVVLPPSPPSLQAANAAATVPARNPRRVSRVGLPSSIADLQIAVSWPDGCASGASKYLSRIVRTRSRQS
jgi:hypothetical protein